ncbi:MAG: hypothetical protein M3552_01315 [Planctomycetota bacterium]|nr:hypothetical protein [Planctomycetaceae bacterium]MDQ3329284.1 hypothetical protein [Planctomycetota bacterium]
MDGLKTDRLLACAAQLAFALVSIASSASAQEFELRAADLRVVGDARWTGGGWGGYHPIRLEITNFGPGRALELRFSPHGRAEGVATVRRRLRIEQNATARMTLPVPLLGGRNSGRFDILIEGEPVEGLREDLSLMPPAHGEAPRASLLVISPDTVNLTGFEIAAFTDAPATNVDMSHGPGRYFHRSGAVSGESRSAIISPALLPTSWIDYASVDLVVVRLDVLASLRPDERTALLDWVATGGRLIVDQVGSPPNESESLARSLGTTASATAAREWKPASIADRQTVPLLMPDLPGGVFTGGGFPGGMVVPNEGSPFSDPLSLLGGAAPQGLRDALRQFQEAMKNDGGAPPNPFAAATWSADEKPFFVRRIGFGRVAAVNGDIFAANGSDWIWLLRGLGGSSMLWPIRNGLASGAGTFEFMEFPIPGVKGVPTTAFLTLITLFTLAIGPVNYIWLWRRKQLSRLVVTVPVIAVATSFVLFAYAAVAHGFGAKGRVRSVTLYDAGSNRATTLSRTAIFSGRAPSRGLQFSKDTAVFPLYPVDQGFISGDVDWTDRQTLTGGWLKSRTRTQFVTTSRRDERGRLTVQRVDGGLRVLNGFEVPLRYVVVTGTDGARYGGRDLAAGGETILKPLSDDLWAELRKLASEVIPELPEGVDPQEMRSMFGGRGWGWDPYGWQPMLRQGLLERHLGLLTGESPMGGASSDTTSQDSVVEIEIQTAAAAIDPAVRQDTLRPLQNPRSFLAIASENPGVDLGGISIDERKSVHVMMGTW